jgi:hypothetical protein
MGGVRLSSWQGQDRICSLEIMRLESTPKRLGPFRLADSQDIAAQDCRLQVDGAALVPSFQEMGRMLLDLAQTRRTAPPSPHQSESNDPIALIVLPPKIIAAPFVCRLRFPMKQWLT